MSIGLQYGVPLRALVDKLVNTRFEPSGFTRTPEIRMASSVLDYNARWLGWKFISPEYIKSGDIGAAELSSLGAPIAASTPGAQPPADPAPSRASFSARTMAASAPTCSNCGMLMTPNGSCYKCGNCGGTSGCS
jgi:ribonucleoside-diphosphate reductase alpha chain